MKFPLFVALRYFFSKKDWSVVHVISLISIVGIGVSSMALLVVLSVFNGFAGVAERMLAYSKPDIMVESGKGKTLSLDSVDVAAIRRIEGVRECTPVVRESVLMSLGDAQGIVTMTGTPSNYGKTSGMDTMMHFGEFFLGTPQEPNAVLGHSIAMRFGLNKGAEKMNLSLRFCSPKNDIAPALVPEENLNIASAVYAGCFMVEGDMDEQVVFVPLEFAQELLDYDKRTVTSLDIATVEGKTQSVKAELGRVLSSSLIARDRAEQDPLYFKVVKAERLAVYIILSFIIFIASFNVMGSISLFAMLKRDDIKILTAMGTRRRGIRGIFFIVGVMLSLCGSLAGVLAGSLICFLQQRFGIVKLGSENFVVSSFPVELHFWDAISVLLLVMAIASLCVSVMVKRIKIGTNKDL